MTAPGDLDEMFNGMFASFVGRKIRRPSTPTPNPHHPTKHSHRTNSDHPSIATLLSGPPGYRSHHSSSPHCNNSSASAAAPADLAAANSLAGTTPYGHQRYRHSNGPSRRQCGKLSEKTASTDEDRPLRKKSRTNIVRSQSAHAGSPHQSSSRKQDKSKSHLEQRGNAATPVEPMESVAPRPVNAPRARGAARGRSFPCERCESVFAEKGQLSRHVRRVHEKLRPYACEHCGKLFGARNDCTRHAQFVHNKCPHCKYMFGNKDSLQEHIRIVHHGEVPFTCNECGMSFGLRSKMLKHQQTVHNREKKWPCHLCPKAFYRKQEMERHQSAVHNKELKWQCDLCPKAFNRKYCLGMHIRRVHESK